MTLRIVQAKPEDAPVLTGIAFASKRSWGYPESWINAWRDSLTITPEFIVSNPVHWAGFLEDDPVAFYALRMEKETCWLEHLWVLPGFMRQGIGAALFKHGMERARAIGAKIILIESDPNAEPFYLKLGAERIGSKKSEIENVIRELPLLSMRSYA